MIKDLKTESQAWEDATLAKLAKNPERKPGFNNSSGVEIKRLYTPLDTEQINFLEDLEFPGRYPFTRGIQPTMYRGQIWSMRQ